MFKVSRGWVWAAAFCVLFFSRDRCLAENAEWQELKGDHFIVYYRMDEKFAKNTLRLSEVYYNQIASDLGYPRYSNFWQWDNRVKIYLHPTRDEFLRASGQAEWSNGMASYTRKEIETFTASDGFLDGILPHEITHLIFRDFVGFKGEVPLWLDEGVAQWEEPKKRALAKPVALNLFQNNRQIPLKELTGIRDLATKDEQSVYYFYMQSICLVDFLIRRYGAPAFTDFCRQLRDGKNLEEALSFAYPGSLDSLELLEAKWKKYVTENERR